VLGKGVVSCLFLFPEQRWVKRYKGRNGGPKRLGGKRRGYKMEKCKLRCDRRDRGRGGKEITSVLRGTDIRGEG